MHNNTYQTITKTKTYYTFIFQCVLARRFSKGVRVDKKSVVIVPQQPTGPAPGSKRTAAPRQGSGKKAAKVNTPVNIVL